MRITINDSKKIITLQEAFNKQFPYLKIEFFSKPHTKGAGSPQKLMKSSSLTLGECRTVNKSGHVTIAATMTVSELEQEFQDNYGLSVQVFRKSGRSWLETTATDAWTLEKQNTEGEALSKLRHDNSRPEIDME